jgi:hypothetical protein
LTRPNFCLPNPSQKVSFARTINSQSAERLVSAIARISFFRKKKIRCLSQQRILAGIPQPRIACQRPVI